jgi:hypothetical protein
MTNSARYTESPDVAGFSFDGGTANHGDSPAFNLELGDVARCSGHSTGNSAKA